MRAKTKNFIWMTLALVFGIAIYKAYGKEGFVDFVKSGFKKEA